MVCFKIRRCVLNRILRIVNILLDMFFKRVWFIIFGLDIKIIEFCSVFILENVIVFGVLSCLEVVVVFCELDIFFDFFDYQVFGRIVLEVMVFGCIVVVFDKGGVDEFVVFYVNLLVVDIFFERDCVSKIVELIYFNNERLFQIKLNVLEMVLRYFVKRVVMSILNFFYL